MECEITWLSDLPYATLANVIKGDIFNKQQYKKSLEYHLKSFEHLSNNPVEPQSMHDIC